MSAKKGGYIFLPIGSKRIAGFCHAKKPFSVCWQREPIFKRKTKTPIEGSFSTYDLLRAFHDSYGLEKSLISFLSRSQFVLAQLLLNRPEWLNRTGNEKQTAFCTSIKHNCLKYYALNNFSHYSAPKITTKPGFHGYNRQNVAYFFPISLKQWGIVLPSIAIKGIKNPFKVTNELKAKAIIHKAQRTYLEYSS